VHRVRTNDEEIGTTAFNVFGSRNHQLRGLLPLSLALKNLNFGEIHRVQDALGRMMAAKLFPYGFVNNAIVFAGRFPAYAADKTNGFQNYALELNGAFGFAKFKQKWYWLGDFNSLKIFPQSQDVWIVTYYVI
jgi:hypothetical protein